MKGYTAVAGGDPAISRCSNSGLQAGGGHVGLVHSMFEKEQSITKFYVKDFRRFGQPKLKKPKELYRINPAFSVAYNPKCMCQVFLEGNDVWVKHRDYFSPSLVAPEDYGKTLNQLCDKYMGKTRSKKFVYEDAWGDIIARAEAWIRLKNLMADIRTGVFALDIVANILRQQEETHSMEIYELCCTPMERFWEQVIFGLIKYQETRA